MAVHTEVMEVHAVTITNRPSIRTYTNTNTVVSRAAGMSAARLQGFAAAAAAVE